MILLVVLGAIPWVGFWLMLLAVLVGVGAFGQALLAGPRTVPTAAA